MNEDNFSPFAGEHHSFDIGLAATYGIEEAILIHHFQFWIRLNRSKGLNIRNGSCWTYQSRKDIQLHFPYWNIEKVKYICEKLVNIGVLITANFNRSPLDRTLWYSFVDEKLFKVDEESLKNLYERQKYPSQKIFENPRDSKKVCVKEKVPLEKEKVPNIYKDTDTKQQIQKEKNKQKDSETPPLSLRLAISFFEKLLKINPTIDKPCLEKWAKVFDFMLRVDARTEEQINAIIDYVISTRNIPSSNGFSWSSVILSPAALRKNYAKIWAQMTFIPNVTSSTTQENEKIAKKIFNKYSSRNDILLGYNYIEFNNGPTSGNIKFEDPKFKELVFHQLRKRNLPVDGL
jgi:hypothetical protein